MENNTEIPDDSSIPPSFIPQSQHNRTNLTDSAASLSKKSQSDLPPSFTPSSGSNGKPQMTLNSHSTRVGNPAASVTRSPRHSGGASHTPYNNGSSLPQSIPPELSNRNRRSHQYSNQLNPQSATPKINRNTNFSPYRTAPRRHRHWGRIFSIGVLLLVIAVIGGSVAGYRWIDSQLHHFNALTTMANDSSQTWLITGSDARDGTPGTGTNDSVEGERTDTIMLLVKPQTGPSALISIPRDTYVEVQGEGMKINAVAQEYGWPALSGQVENITGLKVDHMIRIGFGGIEGIVNALNGVELCYDTTVNDSYSGMNWTAGCHLADGGTALAFSRMRYSDPQGDIGRAERQRQVIQAIIKKTTSPQNLINIPQTMNVISSGLQVVYVDENANPTNLVQMGLTFKEATSDKGITGTPYIKKLGYTPSYDIGSTILLDDDKTANMFSQIAAGSIPGGTTVGGLSS